MAKKHIAASRQGNVQLAERLCRSQAASLTTPVPCDTTHVRRGKGLIMAVRFIIGRAGSGKTHYCLNALRECLQQDPIDGPRLILLVPEQASLQMERAILSPTGVADKTVAPSTPPAGPISGAHRAEVLSFQRLAYRVLDGLGGAPRRALTESARAMVLRHLVARRSNDLQYYGRAARAGASGGRFGGFVERLGATVAELIQEAVEPEALVAEAATTAPGGEDPALNAKLHDLHLIYQAYLDYLGTDRLDPSQRLQVARDALPQCRWLEGAQVWVDGFASLSGQEALTLAVLAGQCHHVDITVMMDPSLCQDSPPPTPSTRAAGRLFSKICRTYQNLRDRFIRAGLVVEDPLVLDPQASQPARTSTPTSRLERALFMPSDACATAVVDPPENVELLSLPSRRIEVDYAVSRVCRWVRDADTRYRYRDIAIIVRDLEPYHDLISEALAAHGVPFFIDRRRPVAHHPLVELLRAGVTMAAEAMSLESVRLVLKTGLVSVALEAADELENYLLAHGIAGWDAWHSRDWPFRARKSFAEPEHEPNTAEVETLSRINAARRSLLQDLDPWLTFASREEGHSGGEWAAALLDLLDRIGAGEALKSWADDAEADGDLDQAEEHRQVWCETMSFLDDLAFAFADTRLTIRELTDVLEAGLSGLTLGLVPPMVDQVLVGSIERSRHPDIKAVLILGFNDGVFPKPLFEDSILNDDDRAMLNEAGVGVRPAARERVPDEALLVYVALTRASETTVVTYATADNDGKSLRPSPYVDALIDACPGLVLTTIGDPGRLRETWDILSARDLTERLAMEFRGRPARDRDDGSLRERWNALYDAVRGELLEDNASRCAMAALDEGRTARISGLTVERLYRGPLRTSVSELETYAACPFQHFARYVLRLREREEATLEPVDVGQVHHAILEDFVGTVAARRQGFEQLSEGELLDRLGESCARVATRLPEGGALSDARNAYRLRRSACELARVMQAQRRRSQSGSAQPRATELPFGFQRPGSLPALTLSTPAGRRVFLRGYIDRVDLMELSDELLGIVIDYKRTREKRLSAGDVYHGLSLQLLAYLLVLGEVGETLAGRPVRPIGALYVSLASQYHSVEHPSLQSARDLALSGTYRPRGLLLAETFEALDRSSDTGWSSSYSLYRNKDGSAGHIDSSDAADAASFQALLDHTRVKLGQLADGVLDGDVAVNPYRLGTFSPCSWCTMSSVCRFEMGISEVRFLASLKRSELFRRLTGTPA